MIYLIEQVTYLSYDDLFLAILKRKWKIFISNSKKPCTKWINVENSDTAKLRNYKSFELFNSYLFSLNENTHSKIENWNSRGCKTTWKQTLN